MAAMVRKQISIDREQHERLKRLAHATGLSEAALIRRALDSYLHRVGRLVHDPGAWAAEVARIDRLITEGPSAGGRTWSRADLYERHG